MTLATIRRRWFPPVFFLTIGSLFWITACATVPDQTQWIRPGKTTKADIVSRYGDPDLVQTTSNGTIATYRPTASKRPAPAVEIPTVQAGPFGTTVTTTKPVERTLGSDDSTTGKREWIKQEIHIRYDEQGIVQEVFN